MHRRLRRVASFGLILVSPTACVGERFEAPLDGISSPAPAIAVGGTDGPATPTTDVPVDTTTDGITPNVPGEVDGVPNDAVVTEGQSPEPPTLDGSAPNTSAPVEDPEPVSVPDAGSPSAGTTDGLEPTPVPEAGLPTEPSEAAGDECPEHPEQALRGSCGCGFEPDEACVVLAASLAHRYSFEGTGTTAVDEVAGADGELHNTELTGAGLLELDGDSAYVELPPHMMSVFSEASFELWIRWDGGDENQRLINFGTLKEDGSVPPTFLSFTPRNGSNELSVGIRSSQREAQYMDVSTPLRRDGVRHLTIVFDDVEERMTLYMDGERIARKYTEHSLTRLEDGTNWLGRALYSAYPYFAGAILEFRIHDIALNDDQVQMSEQLGPDATFPSD